MLEARARAPTTEQRDAFRARIVLLADEGCSTRSIARALGTMPRTVSTWRGRFAREGLAGLADKPRPRPAPKYTSETGRRILAILGVLDNLNTHKPRKWLKRHPNVRFHFTPTRVSWLNQVEIWLSILEGQSLHGASFTSVAQLREHIDAFINAYNGSARPLVWTKAKVHQRRVKGRRISEL